MNQDLSRAAAAGAVRQSGDREFGLVMAAACAIFTLGSAWKQWGWPRPLWPLAGLVFLATALIAPALLSPLNKAWSLLGRLLHRIMNPLVLGLMYFGFLTPFGWLFRLFKSDPLRLRRDGTAESYWISRDPEQQPGKSMENQF